MNKTRKHLMLGALAASLALTPAVFSQAQAAFAAEDTSSTGTVTANVSSTTPAPGTYTGHRGGGMHRGGHMGFMDGGSMMEQAADVLGLEQSELIEQLQDGQTLAEIAEAQGIAKATLIEKLTAAAAVAIDAKVAEGTITEEQATVRKEQLTERLTQMVDSEHMGGGMGIGKGRGFGHFGQIEDVAELLGLTEDELRTELQAGKSLVEIASAKGISEDQLISKIKDGMTDEIKQFVNVKRTPRMTDAENAKTTATAS